MKLTLRIGLIILLTLASGLYLFPWDNYGMSTPSFIKPYKYGLDLHGGVELDYKVDLSLVKEANKNAKTTVNETSVVDSLKTIIDKRVNSLGLAEPTIQTANYGGESHIIVQIPTQDYGNISEEEKQKKSADDIARAKDTIGKVVQLEFREEKKEITEADRAERKTLADNILLELQKSPFATVGAKYRDQYENVGFFVGTGAELPSEARFDGYDKITQFPHRTGVITTLTNERYGTGADGNLTKIGDPGYAVIELYGITSESGSTKKEYSYGVIFVDQRPSEWTPAKTADGKVLNDKYLTRAGISFTQAGKPQVDLIFNDEGKKIFAELTKRLIGKPIAIFVGGQLLTAPTVQSVIPDGRAVITGDYTIASAQELANNITTGIVPAPIYLTSERTIDAKIGQNALHEILVAGLIGLVAIVVFLTIFYHVSGLLAGIALVIYSLILVALIKAFGVVLTLASIAGVILSIGLAIDANILIFERMKEALREGHTLEKSVILGFDKSWTAIWDSHITSFTSAVILYMFGISLIKGFGLMLGLGILLSLFTAMWVSRILILAVGRTRIGKNPSYFVGLKK